MYEALSKFLIAFSSDLPILWALLVMAVIAGTGLGLYAFWEIVLKGASAVFGGHSNRKSNRSSSPDRDSHR